MTGQVRDALVIERLGMQEPGDGTDESSPPERLLVQLSGASSCARCARGEGCGAGLFDSNSKPVRLIVFDELGAEIGQRVTIEAPSNTAWLNVIAGAYGLPTLGLLLGALLPGAFGIASQWTAALSAALGMTLAIGLWQRIIEPRLQCQLDGGGSGAIETVHTVSIESAEVS